MIETRSLPAPYLAGENIFLVMPSRRSQVLGRPWVISPHGRGGAADGCWGWWYGAKTTAALARNGYPVIGIDAGGPFEWASDKAFVAIDKAIEYVRSEFGAPNDFLMWGHSMGGLTSLSYLGTGKYAADQRAAITSCAATDVQTLYQTPAYKTDIDTAWTPEGGWTAANRARKVPNVMILNTLYNTVDRHFLGKLDRIQFSYSENDTTVASAQQIGFATAITDTASSVGLTPGVALNMGQAFHSPEYQNERAVLAFAREKCPL